ncbi:DUF3566 domain-containing protein [Brachybacterium sp. FME24]|uniref:DUF3566 domain-containing protein n=1 Tax=Brachybacterium sp. FME24 TaxID=2742605 RepID=UPI001868B8CF|nr:DUF3566 domain-containing protein [Brachybacterium sp. FME24]
MSTSDARTAASTSPSPEATSKLPSFEEDTSSSEQTIGAGKGSAARGASRSPKKMTTSANPADAEKRGPRRVRLTLARLDPFSVMKLSFLVAIAVGIATVVAVVLMWNLVDAIGLWSQIDQLGRDLNGGTPLPFMEFFGFSKMVSYGTIVAVVNVVIITALGTLLAFLYNLVAALLGGLKMTFTDE